MKIRYNVTGSERKRLASVLADAVDCGCQYLATPTFCYQIGQILVDREGTVIFDEKADPKTVEAINAALEAQGFKAESSRLRISVPLDEVNLENLTGLLSSKGPLIRKALGVEALPVETDEENVYFYWLRGNPDPDTLQAYTHLVDGLCRLSRNLQRVNKTDHPVENEKYAFRCFLIRLGFVGEEYKTDRKILLRNLTGNSAFKSGIRKGAAVDAVPQ